MKQLAALYRNPSYSPNQHRSNDTAILDAVVARLAALGWGVQGTTERAVADGDIPVADLYLNMCQGPDASVQLRNADLADAVVVNRPEAVLNCHRHRLVPMLQRAGLPFPATRIVDVDMVRSIDLAMLASPAVAPIWVKRGDVHAETSDDVVPAGRADVPRVVEAFARRGVRTVALQAHVPGPIVKFYGVAGVGETRFFRWYLADNPLSARTDVVDAERLAELAFGAAEALGLRVFGGDAAVPAPDRPTLIDVNDWPSFALFREEAADAIAAFCHRLATIPRTGTHP